MSLSVIIPSKNLNNLVPCLRAVRANEPNARIIWVDDRDSGCYRDQGYFAAREACEGVGPVVVAGQKPFVFARNINLGIRAAGFDDVVILNDDAMLQTPSGFSGLAEEASAHQEFGIIAATCNNVGNQNQWPQGIGLREEARMVCFVAVLIPRRTIDAVGMLDEEFVGYGLDDDSYSLRVRMAGLKIGIHDGCYVDHGSLTSTYRGDPETPADFRPNLRLFIQKYGFDNRGQSKETSDFPECFA